MLNPNAKRGRWLVAIIALLLIASLSSEAWAAPNRSSLRQTVPTRTPTKSPTEPMPPTATPEPPTSTPIPLAAKPDNGRPRATAIPTEPLVTKSGGSAEANETAIAISEAGYPATGANRTSLFVSALVLIALIFLTAAVWLYRHIKRAL